MPPDLILLSTFNNLSLPTLGQYLTYVSSTLLGLVQASVLLTPHQIVFFVCLKVSDQWQEVKGISETGRAGHTVCAIITECDVCLVLAFGGETITNVQGDMATLNDLQLLSLSVQM